MKRLFQFLIFAPLAIILIAISVANRHHVTLNLDPFNTETPALSFTFPMYWGIFACLVMGIVIGGMVVWMKQGRFRREARDQKFEAARARNEAKKFKQQVGLLGKNALPAPKA
ncbi:MAG: DUF1049 domain-containing protein [Pseudomonadota bacterium]